MFKILTAKRNAQSLTRYQGWRQALIMGQYDMKPPYDPPPMQVSEEEMKAARLPLEFRDQCAHLLIPLNECRYASCRLSRLRAFAAPSRLLYKGLCLVRLHCKLTLTACMHSIGVCVS